MSVPENIYLIGPMGSGKSTIGRYIAGQLHKDFFDCDVEIEKRTGASISLIFEIEGEKGFRKRETTELSRLTQKRGMILATGGGAVLCDQNRDMLRKNGFVIYLSSTAEQLYQRTYRDKNRPLLQTDDPLERLRELLVQREPLYQELADLSVETNQRAARITARNILREIQSL